MIWWTPGVVNWWTAVLMWTSVSDPVVANGRLKAAHLFHYIIILIDNNITIL